MAGEGSSQILRDLLDSRGTPRLKGTESLLWPRVQGATAPLAEALAFWPIAVEFSPEAFALLPYAVAFVAVASES